MVAGKPVDEVEFRRLFNEGRGPDEIADALGLHRATVHAVRMRLGLPGFGRNDKERDERFIQLFNEGKREAEIAEQLGLSPSSIGAIRRRLELPRFGQAKKVPEDEVWRAYHDGLTNDQAAERLGVHRNSLLKIRKSYGVPPFVPSPTGLPKIDRDLLKMLDAEGFTSTEIARHLGCSRDMVTKIRKELGISHEYNNTPYSQEVRDRALEMLEDGAPYIEVERTLGVPVHRTRKWFPGMGWTLQQAIEFRHLKESMDRLDGKPLTALDWR